MNKINIWRNKENGFYVQVTDYDVRAFGSESERFVAYKYLIGMEPNPLYGYTYMECFADFGKKFELIGQLGYA